MMNKQQRGLTLVAVSLLLGGCSWFSWLPWVDGDKEDLAKPAELVKFDSELNLKRQWKTSVGSGLGKKFLRLQPKVVADRIVAADGYGVVQAHDRFSGKRIWRVEIGQGSDGMLSSLNFIDRRDPSFVAGGVGVGAGLILLGTTDGFVHALNVADGSEVWRSEVNSEVIAAPVTDGKLVFAQTIDGRLIALGKDDGEERWSYDNQLPVLTLRGTSTPVVSGDIVFTGFASGKVVAVRAVNGEPIWEHRVMLPEGRSELERMVDADTTPLVLSSELYVGAYQGRVKSLSRRDGRPLWEQEISTYTDFAEGYGQIYVVDDSDVIHAIDRQTGEVTWIQEDFKRRKLSPPIAFSNYLVVGDESGYIHVIAQRDGRHLARRKIDGDGIRSAMTLADNVLFVLGNSGSLQAIDLQLK